MPQVVNILQRKAWVLAVITALNLLRKKTLPKFIGYWTVHGQRMEEDTRSSFSAYTRFESQLVYRLHLLRNMLCIHSFVKDDSNLLGHVDWWRLPGDTIHYWTQHHHTCTSRYSVCYKDTMWPVHNTQPSKFGVLP